MTRFIAVDWGTTNRRCYLVEDGAATATTRDNRGVLAMAGGDWAAEVAAIRVRHGDLPVLIAGMAGSNRGWREAAYVDCPAGLDDIAAGLLWVEPGRSAIVPGVAQRDAARPDVMRGEEVQLLGAVAAGLATPYALLCQPGTHCKWATMRGGRIADIATAMTGELFALLKAHSILAGQIEAPVSDGAAFRDGVRRAGEGDLLGALFGVRAAMLLGMREDAAAASYASGLLIGGDVHAHARNREVTVLADATLAELYVAAIEEAGGAARVADSHAAFVAGITAIAERIV